MNTSTKNIFFACLICFICIVVTAYFVFHHGQSVGLNTANKIYKHQIDSLNQKIDSMNGVVRIFNNRDTLLQRKIDTLNARGLYLKGLAIDESHELNALKQKYNNIPNIGNFNSDSLKNYFSNNFDTTQIKNQ